MENKLYKLLKKKFILDFFDSPNEVFDEINGMKQIRYLNVGEQEYAACFIAGMDLTGIAEINENETSVGTKDFDEIDDCINIEDLEDIEDAEESDIEYLELLLRYEMI